VSGLQAQQAALQKQFSSLADAFAARLVKVLNSTKGGINVGYGPKPKKPKKPPKKAIGSMSLRGGPVIAGDKGVELLTPPGTRVYGNRQTEDMLGQNEPVTLSEKSIALLAEAILAGQVRASQATTSAAMSRLAVRAS